MKVKLVPGSREKFEVGFYSIRDREVLMGFPQGYVEAKGMLIIPENHFRNAIMTKLNYCVPSFNF